MPGAPDDRREVGPADPEVVQLMVIEKRELPGQPRPPAAFLEPRDKMNAERPGAAL